MSSTNNNKHNTRGSDTSPTLSESPVIAPKAASSSSSSIGNNDDVASSVLPGYDIEKSITNQGGDNIVRTESNAEETTDISRVLTNSKAIQKQLSKLDEENVPIPPMGGGRDYPAPLPDVADYTVTFDGPDDPLHPHNWPLKKKVWMLQFSMFIMLFPL
ncbi:unnamed protein product [Ambrosiozyma monospora]|uniref:Unnamed protein product n=1 Tax=Ambrosiozyma monospora TaxID=43982 RepID=A0A9W7DJX1_AMBMO|nr:unnamed protein product [Ambrosiozyma monospora]